MKRTLSNKFIDIVKNENDNTELLKSLFRFESFRNKFLELTDIELNPKSISYEHFRTQHILNNYSCPDIALQNDEIELFFEVKVKNSGLTPNQPNGYYDELKKVEKKTKGLFFILPKFYIGTETIRRKLQEISNNNDFIKTKIIFWDDIINIAEETCSKEEELKQYGDFLRVYFHIKPISFTNKEIEVMFNKETPNGLFKIITLIYDAQTRVLFPVNINKIPKSNFIDDKEYGFSFKIPNYDNEFYIGIWGKYWEETGNPVCFAVQTKPENDNVIQLFKEISEKLDLSEPVDFHEDINNPHLITYFEKETFLEKDLFFKKIENLRTILEII